MKSSEFLTEGATTNIDQHNKYGSLEGYVVNTNQPNLTNYLLDQDVSEDLINELISSYSRIGLIRNMYVDDNYRNRGVGTKLLSRAIDEATDNGAEAIVLVADLADTSNKDLIAWYEGFGFEVIGDACLNKVMVLR